MTCIQFHMIGMHDWSENYNCGLIMIIIIFVYCETLISKIC